MTDRRRHFANERVADAALRGAVAAASFVAPEPRRVAVFASFIHAGPGGRRDRQLLFGDRFDVIEDRAGWSFGRAAKDGYVGYVAAADLGPAAEPTHVVRLRHTYLYPAPDFKLPPLARLPFGGRIRVDEVAGDWARTADGHLRAGHLRPIGRPVDDPVAVAETFLGTPYLWAGNTGDGIDCSGLVQVACLACGIACPGDSDEQVALGEALPADAPLRRGDLLFWKGHVAWVAQPDRILHANAHAMAVTYEELDAALARIAAQGDGPVIARRRLQSGAGG